jgi:hypothetical protein
MAMTTAERTNRRREKLRSEGLRPVTLWVPDTRKAEAQEKIRLQCLAIASAERANPAFEREMEDWLALSAEAIRADER